VNPSRRVVLLAFPGVQPLDLVGPHEVFAGANRVELAAGRPRPYDVQVVGAGPGTVRGESGLGIVLDGPLPRQRVDTIIVPGGDGSRRTEDLADVVIWLRTAGERARRTCAVCTGAFVLAEAGLLDGLRVTTHWARAGELARRYPGVQVDPTPLFLQQGRIWTSAGVTAGIDLALALVEDDLGAEVAQTIARWMVMFLRRSGGQSQFAAEVWTQPRRDPMRTVLRSVHADPGADHRLPVMAERAGMSPRHLQRCFRDELGTTPSAYVTRVRLDAARRLLEREDITVQAAARRSGFGSAETMRRVFVHHLGVAPDLYRDRFRVPRT
jgi:transcriptional regulator GlxA family with amidase domain